VTTAYQHIVTISYRLKVPFAEATDILRASAEYHAQHGIICDLIDLAQGLDRNAQGYCLKCGTPSTIHEVGCPVAYNEREATKPRASVVDTITSIAAELEADQPGFTVDDLADEVGR
jgi:hypothetical protein